MKRVLLFLMVLCSSLFSSTDFTEEEKRELGNQAMHQMMQKIWTEAMEAKSAYNNGVFNTREEYLENVCSTAPVAPPGVFHIHADVSSELAAGDPSASVYISWDGQDSWSNYVASPLDPELVGPGYENTWGLETPSIGTSADWYLAGTVNSEALGYDYGTILLSGSPHNADQIGVPLPPNLYGLLAEDESGDASSAQDILNIKGSYYDDGGTLEDGSGDGAERFYMSMEINGGCCDEGGLFGPWYLYGVGIVNPDSETPVAYAIGYGDGGFGQLLPGLLKITGDLSTGEIDGFDYITTDINYNTNGDFMQATTLMSYITNDADWGDWPNSVYGFIALGVTVEASLDGLDVAADIKDETSPGLFIMNSIHQVGNNVFELDDLSFDSDNMILSTTYSDEDGNLPWFKSIQICENVGGFCYFQEVPIPDSHTYEDGVIFSADVTKYITGYCASNIFGEDDLDFDNEESCTAADGTWYAPIPDGEYVAKFAFADGEYNPNDVEYLDITIGEGGTGCALVGDVNEDDTLNILDVVLLVNLILSGSDAECGDANGDDTTNILDVVLLVNIILAG